jgi:hypothetical protein
MYRCSIGLHAPAVPAIPSRMAQPLSSSRPSTSPTFMQLASQMNPAVLRACPKHPSVFRVVFELPWLQLPSLTFCGNNCFALLLDDLVDLPVTRAAFHTLSLTTSAFGLENLAVQTEQFHFCCSKMDSSKMNNPPSLNPPVNMDIDSFQIPVLEPGYKESNQEQVVKGEGWGKRQCEGERGFTIFKIEKLSLRNLKPFQAFCLYFFAAHSSS